MVRENLKTEMLQIFVEMAQRKDAEMTHEEKEYVLDKMDELVELYDVAGRYRSVKIQNEDTGEVELTVVPIEDVEQLANNFRESIAKLMFELIRMGLIYGDYSLDNS